MSMEHWIILMQIVFVGQSVIALLGLRGLQNGRKVWRWDAGKSRIVKNSPRVIPCNQYAVLQWYLLLNVLMIFHISQWGWQLDKYMQITLEAETPILWQVYVKGIMILYRLIELIPTML